MSTVIDQNFNLHFRFIPAQTPGMKVFTKPGITYVDSGLSCDTFNVIHVTDGISISAKDMEEAVAYYRARSYPFCLWINEENLTAAIRKTFSELGLTKQNAEPGMILDLDAYTPAPAALNENAVIASRVEHVRDFADVIARNWTPPDHNVTHYYAKTAALILANRHRVSLAIWYQDDKPVSVIEMFASDDENVGLYALATLADYRGQGIGSALLRFALNHLKGHGFKKVILQASEDGIGIYRKIGFQMRTTYFEFGRD